ncbi:HXXEE domain-containing protein [Lederbergia panacisoli]|uniref:HXXEE domain-containing protein n=1 Tax=Lederbergia panacisoli TaxID=1255251 RepID=UPI00214AD16E|nr:HXXEE domain-containing protein [Lederbergia panacisoli]MCR2822072.1 HXXEE domain-containing protein [Lederbergia panacisoli]
MLEAFSEFFYIYSVIWLFPIIFMFHDLEEIITVESFMSKYKNGVHKTILARFVLIVKNKLGSKSSQLSITLAWILLIISFITFMTVYHLPSDGNFLLFTATLNVFFLQTFLHIGQTVIFRSYTPGVITALFIVIPYSLLTYYFLFDFGLIDSHLLIESIPFSILLIPIFLIGNFLGKRLIH